MARDKLIHYPTVTREPFRNQGRLTEIIASGRLFSDTGLPSLDPAVDRAMICGSARCWPTASGVAVGPEQKSRGLSRKESRMDAPPVFGSRFMVRGPLRNCTAARLLLTMTISESGRSINEDLLCPKDRGREYLPF
jgi:hypothetical protein